jgi:Neurotransmitter-gated ion-channel ligand binding domain
VKRRRSRARALTLGLFAIAVCFGFVLFPLHGRGAEPPAAGDSSATAKPAAGKGKGARKAAAADAGALQEAGAPADGGALAVASAAQDAGAAAPVTSSTNAPLPEDKELKSIPIGRGLPVKVNVGVFFLEVKSFDDIKGEFEATVDLRLKWRDSRLGAVVGKTIRGYREFRGKEAEDEIAKIWTPTVEVTNRLESSGYVGRRLRVYPDGMVELLTRTTAKHTAQVDAETFPFDRQHLSLDLIVREDTTDEVVFGFDTEDVSFSRAARDAKLSGWNLSLVDLHTESVAGWNGDRYSRLVAALSVDRQASTSLAPIFIPLFASLLIPLLAIWMNKASEDGDGFEVDAFELANMGIGGLFSVIALSFAVYSSYGVIANGDNTVTRLFGLNYAMLAITLAIVVVCFRFNVLGRLFGPYVQREVFHFLSWSLPILSLATSVAFLLVAAA